jgi:hypothetical protein
MSNKKTERCPRCHGVGLEETSIGGRRCRKCTGSGRVPIENPSALGVCGPNGDRPQGRPGGISPDAENRFISEKEDFTVIKSRRLIAVSGDRFLEQLTETEGRVIIPSEGYIGPVHSIASIAARGYWEPLVKEVADKVILSTTHDHTQKTGRR